MSDGAGLGIDARAALGGVFGDPEAQERIDADLPASAAEARERAFARVTNAPDPMDGPPIWDRVEAGELTGDDGYALVADCIAKAFVRLHTDNPALTGMDDLWAATAYWPGFSDWLGGPSGFQVGFAYNTALLIWEGAPGRTNPAILEVRAG